MNWLARIKAAWQQAKRKRSLRKVQAEPASVRLALFDVNGDMVGEAESVEFGPADKGLIASLNSVTLGPVGDVPLSEFRLIDEDGHTIYSKPFPANMPKSAGIYFPPGDLLVEPDFGGAK